MRFPRASGILLHPTSLPGDYGIGDLGLQAYKFVDFLAEAGQAYWQILPLGPTGYGDSPYQCFSAFAGNTLMISPEKLAEDGLLITEILTQKRDFTADKVDFGKVFEWKNDRTLPEAYKNFRSTTNAGLYEQFEAFCGRNAWWLDDYALYRAIKFSQDQKAWYEWDASLKLRDENALNDARQKLSDAIEAQKFYQFLFFKQWLDLKKYANDRGIKIIGDVPIFVALDSADVWRNPQEFKLNEDGSPKVVAGVPPDYFSKTGQLWGNPIYDWDAMRNDGFRWWTSRVDFTLKTVDIVRIDHFIGLTRCWEVPAGNKTAENGQWVNAPGRELLEAVKKALGDLPLIAEDLGVVTAEVEELRDSFGFPGMRILQFAFGSDAKNGDLPHNHSRNCVVYTGTHDNETTVGWLKARSKSDPASDTPKINKELGFCLKYLNSNGSEIHWDFIRAIWASVADTAIVPMQDVLGLGNEARMNLPASTSGNWNWRFTEGAVTSKIAARLKELTEIYGRNGKG